LFRNLEDGKFEEIGIRTGAALSRRYVGRGAAVGDFENRGAEDVLMTVLDGSPVLLRNRTANTNHWITIKTVGTQSNRDGFGARVRVKAGSLVHNAEVRANSSFESASDPRLHFGVGAAQTIDHITVRWPSGRVDEIGPESADQELIIKEGQRIISRLPKKPR